MHRQEIVWGFLDVSQLRFCVEGMMQIMVEHTLCALSDGVQKQINIHNTYRCVNLTHMRTHIHLNSGVQLHGRVAYMKNPGLHSQQHQGEKPQLRCCENLVKTMALMPWGREDCFHFQPRQTECWTHRMSTIQASMLLVGAGLSLSSGVIPEMALCTSTCKKKNMLKQQHVFKVRCLALSLLQVPSKV